MLTAFFVCLLSTFLRACTLVTTIFGVNETFLEGKHSVAHYVPRGMARQEVNEVFPWTSLKRVSLTVVKLDIKYLQDDLVNEKLKSLWPEAVLKSLLMTPRGHTKIFTQATEGGEAVRLSP